MGAHQMPSSPVLVLGEALVDEVTRGDDTVAHVGGACLNIACGTARLGHDTTLACWIARDEYGRLIGERLAEAGVRLPEGSDGAESTTVAHALLDDAGHATYTFDVASDLPPLTDIERYGHVHAGSIAAIIEPGATKIRAALQAARPTATTSYDPNVRPALAGEREDEVRRAEDYAAASDVVKASDEDLRWLYPDRTAEEAAGHLLELGPALVVVTRGGEGALALVGSSAERLEEPAVPASVADTVGAGDSFMAGLLSGLLDAGLLGGPDARDRLRRASAAQILPALRRAARTASVTVGRAGAYAPTRDQIA